MSFLHYICGWCGMAWKEDPDQAQEVLEPRCPRCGTPADKPVEPEKK